MARWIASADRSLLIEVQAAKTDLQHEVIRRAVRVGDGPAIATVEDLLVLKLIANRPKDRGDLVGLAALPGIDWAYVERWAAEWGFGAALAHLRSDRPG